MSAFIVVLIGMSLTSQLRASAHSSAPSLIEISNSKNPFLQLGTRATLKEDQNGRFMFLNEEVSKVRTAGSLYAGFVGSHQNFLKVLDKGPNYQAKNRNDLIGAKTYGDLLTYTTKILSFGIISFSPADQFNFFELELLFQGGDFTTWKFFPDEAIAQIKVHTRDQIVEALFENITHKVEIKDLDYAISFNGEFSWVDPDWWKPSIHRPLYSYGWISKTFGVQNADPIASKLAEKIRSSLFIEDAYKKDAIGLLKL